MSVKIAVLKETRPNERRVAMVPAVADKLAKLGVEIHMQSGAGNAVKLPDSAFKNVTFAANPQGLVSDADIVLAVQPPTAEVVGAMKEGSILLSFIYAHKEAELTKQLRDRKITCFAMELVPRITRAQAMDALSSQAALAARVDAGFDELGAERFGLLLGFRTHVVAFHLAAEAARGGEGLQAGDAQTHHQGLGRADRADRGGHHRQDARDVGGAEQGGVITGQGGLAGQGVHGLGAGNARHQFHGEAGDLAITQLFGQLRFLVGVDEGQQDGAFLHRTDDFGGRRLHRQHDVGVAYQTLRVGSESDVLEGAVRQLHGIAGAGLHMDFDAELG